MAKVLENGFWTSERWEATDAKDFRNKFLALTKFWYRGSYMPGLHIREEENPHRLTTRSELACLCSWQLLVEKLKNIETKSGWFLLMEDDLGSSLASPHMWPFDFDQLIDQAGTDSLIIQLAPINGRVRNELFNKWLSSGKINLVSNKLLVKTHGNGAILLNKKAVPHLSRCIGGFLQKIFNNIHILEIPRSIRPVADKWIYASLPAESCFVLNFPIFCLDAETSSLHNSHVKSFHNASKQATLKIWNQNSYDYLVKNYNDYREV